MKKSLTHTQSANIKKNRFFIEKNPLKTCFQHIEKNQGDENKQINKQTNKHRMFQTNRTAQLAVKNSNQKMTSNNLFEDMP